MGSREVRRLSALLLATAALFTASAAQALTISAKVGPLLQEAQSLIQAKNYKAASAKLDEAEAAKSYPDDETVINQFRQYLAVASSHPAQP
jgi:hypothetical protein